MPGKCPVYRCKSSCCYNVPFPYGFLEAHAGAVVSPYGYVVRRASYVIPMTNPDPDLNKCPFLRADLKCNIYADRPEICRKMAECPEMACPFRV